LAKRSKLTYLLTYLQIGSESVESVLGGVTVRVRVGDSVTVMVDSLAQRWKDERLSENADIMTRPK